MELKTCATCNIEKELSSFYSGIDKRRNRPYIFAICKSCHRVREREWKKNNPQKAKEIQVRNQNNNGHKFRKTQYEKWKKDWITHSHQRKQWEANGKRVRADLTFALVEHQGNECAICHKSFSNSRFDIDHNHETGLVRGLLCRKCNSGLHYFEDKSFIEKAGKYLLEYPAKSYPPTKY